jgi:hypothetical protein
MRQYYFFSNRKNGRGEAGRKIQKDNWHEKELQLFSL